MTLLAQLIFNSIVNGAMFAVLAIGFGLVYRSTQVFHVAYGSSFVLLAFVFYALVVGAGFPWWIAGIATVAAGALTGWGMEAWFYGPLRRSGAASGAAMVASLGLGIVIENLLVLFWGNEIRAIPRNVDAVMLFGEVRVSNMQAAQLVICSIVLAGLAAAGRSEFFRIVRAMGENAGLLQVLGHPLPRYRSLVFALSGALTAVPACLFMLDVGTDANAGMSWLLIAVIAVLTGGVAHMQGWVLGALLLALLQSLVVWRFSARWMDLVAFALLIVVLLFRPEGLVGVRRRAEEA